MSLYLLTPIYTDETFLLLQRTSEKYALTHTYKQSNIKVTYIETLTISLKVIYIKMSVARNGVGDPSSNPRQGFTSNWNFRERHKSLFSSPSSEKILEPIGLVVECSAMAREYGFQSKVESYQRLKTCYLIPLCLILSIIRYVSRVK